LTKNPEEKRRADFVPSVERNCHVAAVGMLPLLVPAGPSLEKKPKKPSNSLEIALSR
jgi:hypothetical protein